MGYRCFEVEVTEGVAHVALSRPDELNTMVPEFWGELPRIVGEIDAAGSARAIVISSTGRHFSAGMDISVFDAGGAAFAGPQGEGGQVSPEPGRTRAHLRQLVMLLQDALSSLERARMPVLAAVQGGCVGGAVDMICACDMRYATSDAFFVIQETNIAMTADVGTLQRLPRLIPEGVAREYAFTGRRMSADRAYELGLVNAVYADADEMLAGVMETAREIASKSPLAIWGIKEMCNYSRDHGVADALAYMATWQAGMFHPDDVIEAFGAKAEGRPAVFDDLNPSPRSL